MNYYEVLEVKRDASQAEIRRHYKTLIKKYHPDLYEGDKKFAEEKTMQINMAYDVLSVPELKEEYDIELELEERKSSENNNPIKNTDESENEEYNDYMNDRVFRDMYARYNYYKNDYIFHKKYSKNKSNYSTYHNSYYDRMEREFGKKVSNAENYVERKISVLESRQKVLLAIIACFVVMLFFLVSIYRIEKITAAENAQNKREPKEYQVKPDTSSDYENNFRRLITEFYNSYLTEPSDGLETQKPNVEPDVPLEEEKKSGISIIDGIKDYLKEKYYNIRFNVGNYEINTDVLNGISSDVKSAIDYYYNAIKDVVSSSDLNRYSEDEIKAIIYEYLQNNNKFNWYEEE